MTVMTIVSAGSPTIPETIAATTSRAIIGSATWSRIIRQTLRPGSTGRTLAPYSVEASLGLGRASGREMASERQGGDHVGCLEGVPGRLAGRHRVRAARPGDRWPGAAGARAAAAGRSPGLIRATPGRVRAVASSTTPRTVSVGVGDGRPDRRATAGRRARSRQPRCRPPRPARGSRSRARASSIAPARPKPWVPAGPGSRRAPSEPRSWPPEPTSRTVTVPGAAPERTASTTITASQAPPGRPGSSRSTSAVGSSCSTTWTPTQPALGDRPRDRGGDLRTDRVVAPVGRPEADHQHPGARVLAAGGAHQMCSTDRSRKWVAHEMHGS